MCENLFNISHLFGCFRVRFGVGVRFASSDAALRYVAVPRGSHEPHMSGNVRHVSPGVSPDVSHMSLM